MVIFRARTASVNTRRRTFRCRFTVAGETRAALVGDVVVDVRHLDLVEPHRPKNGSR